MWRKKYPYDCFVVSNIQYIIVADILMSETQNTIRVITYSSYFLEVLVEL